MLNKHPPVAHRQRQVKVGVAALRVALRVVGEEEEAVAVRAWR
jgi:hypothetical protein